MNDVVIFLAALLLAVTFGWSGTVKVVRTRRWLDALSAYRIPRPLEPLVFVAVPVAEIAIAGLILVGATTETPRPVTTNPASTKGMMGATAPQRVARVIVDDGELFEYWAHAASLVCELLSGFLKAWVLLSLAQRSESVGPCA